MNLAIKYRPRLLSDLVGQDVFVRTIENAITLNMLSNVFMICGPSGSGKTTSARILGLCLNCDNGITPTPCLVCKNCTEILLGDHPDVTEIDAASRTGIDDVRAIISSTHYSPLEGRFKLYIIDEVHMLSQSAFNALLKTIEQPPAHVKFILATTDIKKVPDTIVSRCQVFRFCRIPAPMISLKLQKVAKSENVLMDQKSFDAIAAHSHGSLRNALMFLDQIISYSNGQPSFESTKSVLGIIDDQLILDLMEAILDRQLDKALDITDKIQQNFDPVTILENLSTLCYKLTMLDSIGQSLFDKEYHQKAKTLLLKSTSSLSVRMWQVTNTCISEIMESYDSYIALKMGIVKLCMLSALPSPGAVIQQIRQQTMQQKKELTNQQQCDFASTKLDQTVNSEELATKHTEEVSIKTFEELCNGLLSDSEVELYNALKDEHKLVQFKVGKLEITSETHNDKFRLDLEKYLFNKTGISWNVTIINENDSKILEKIKGDEFTQDLIRKFSGSTVSFTKKTKS